MLNCVLDESKPKKIAEAKCALWCARLPTRTLVMPGRGREKTGLLPPAFPCFPSLSSVYLLQSSPISCRDHNRKRHVLTFRSKLRDKEDWYKWKYVWAIFYYRRTHDGLTTTNNERSAPNRGSVDQLTHSNCNIGCENRLFSVNHVSDRQIDSTM